MGDAVVSALVTEVVRRLTSIALQEFSLLWGFNSDILTLKEDFTNIQAVLEDAEEKHIKERAVNLWLKSLKSASLEVENVLDDISTEALLRRLYKEKGIKHRVRASFSFDHNQLMFRVRIVHKVRAIRRKLDAIASKRSELSLTHSVIGHVDVDVSSEMPNRETSSLIHDSLRIFGRNEEMEMVTEKICNKHIGKYDIGKIRVYGIWGMGGVGKTTLAQLVYNHERVSKYFELKCWVYVSENFQVKEIMKNIIETIDKYVCTVTQLETLQESLQSKLKKKKFLIVLDDVWIEGNEKSKWDQLYETLSCGAELAEESIIVMTTRSQTTSRMMAKVLELQHELGCLSDDDSWMLFKKFAFAEGRERDDISEPIGREIVEKCKGLPLAIKTLGSLMWSKNNSNDWQLVKDSYIWELQESKVLPALKLSYDNLLPHIKRCFAYCCLFPKGYEIKRDALIPMWVSNGFIPPREDIDLHRLGEEVFNCLVWRSFFIVKVFKFGAGYVMHDLMHDMGRHVMGDDFLIIESKENKVANEVFHLSSSYPDKTFSSKESGKLTSLRSVFMYRVWKKGDVSQIFNHVYLKVLCFYETELRTLPKSICKLKHLKYLNLSHSSIRVLPKSIIHLQNLQVLFLFFCRNLHELPQGLRYMVNLQHLDIRGCISLLYLPFGIGKLTSLRRLPWFLLGVWPGAKLGELENLNLLEGELKISEFTNVKDPSVAKSAMQKKFVSFEVTLVLPVLLY